MIQIIKHPVVEHHLTILRDKTTGNSDFRNSASAISNFLAAKALENMNLSEKIIETPMKQFKGSQLADDVVFVPVLRAGLALLEPFTKTLPSAKISFMGLSRNESNFNTEEYYFSKPDFSGNSIFIILEMMIATGGSVCSTISRLQMEGANKFMVCSIISAPEGIEKIRVEHPSVQIITAALDEGLNEKKYIVPGLGDAGDRWCGI